MHDFEVQAQERTRAHPFPFGDRLNGISWIRRQTDIEKPMALNGTVNSCVMLASCMLASQKK